MDIEFRVLGPLEVVVDGASIECGGPKQRTLLAALLVNADQTVSLDRLVEAVWPVSIPATAKSNVQVYVSMLRRSLGSARSRLQTRAPGYALHAGEALDAARFALLAEQGRAALVKGEPGRAQDLLFAALALWRGPALAEFVYEPFAEREAARLEELRLTTTADSIDARLELGKHKDLIGELEALVGLHPTDERLCGQLMLAQYRSGRQADALASYRRLRDHLGEELGIVPSSLLQQLHGEIVMQRPELDPPAAGSQLRGASDGPSAGQHPPGVLTDFVGREDEKAAVTERLDRARLVTISGPGGSGKTRLALEVCSLVAATRRVRFADLALIGSSDLVLPAVGEALGVEDSFGAGTEELWAAIDACVTDLPGLLLVLDNCEHVVDATAEVVHAALVRLSELQVLATSQVALRVAGESLVSLSPLGLPREGDEADEVAASEAVRLFATRARDHDSQFSLTPETAQSVARICRQLDGMPLAVELAAAQTQAFGLEEIERRLDDALGFLRGGPRTAVDRHRTLRAAVDWSIELLSEAERELLERLAVFNGGFTLTGVEGVCAGDGIAPDEVPTLLAALVERSLVIRRSRGRAERYWLLETIRQYGWSQLAARD